MIVPMLESHIVQIAALEKLCFSDPWSENSVRSELSNPLSLWLVAEEEGRVTGYVGSQSVPPEADVMNLAVAPDCRKKGIGRALMEALIAQLRSQGMAALFLEVRVGNLPARSLYQSLGFVEVGRRQKYYVNPTEDALILRKELTDADTVDRILL